MRNPFKNRKGSATQQEAVNDGWTHVEEGGVFVHHDGQPDYAPVWFEVPSVLADRVYQIAPAEQFTDCLELLLTEHKLLRRGQYFDEDAKPTGTISSVPVMLEPGLSVQQVDSSRTVETPSGTP